jgi:DNA-binding winged helix-turn-helix (wHTH) protein
MIYHFDDFELDMARFELRDDGAVQPLEPQVLTLLAYLIEHRERLVPKNELFEKLWDGRVVTDSTLTSRIKSARRAVGDSGKAQQFIKTIHGKGFRFIADVQYAHNSGIDSHRSSVEPTARVCLRCAARLNNAALSPEFSS